MKIVELEKEVIALKEEKQRLLQELLYYKRYYFGRRSEKRMPDVPDGQLFLPFEGEKTLPEIGRAHV